MQDERPARSAPQERSDAKVFRLVQGQPVTGPVLQERRRSEVLFRKLLEAAPDAVVITAADGTIVLANPRAEQMFGYESDELVGLSVEALIPEDLRPRHRVHRKKYADHPHVRPMGGGQHLRALRKDGTIFPAEISLSPVESEGGLLIFSSIRESGVAGHHTLFSSGRTSAAWLKCQSPFRSKLGKQLDLLFLCLNLAIQARRAQNTQQTTYLPITTRKRVPRCGSSLSAT